MRVRSAREFDVNELVEILNSEEQTSSSSLPSPMRSPGAAKPRTDSRKEGIRTPPVTSWSRIDPEDAVVTNRERRAWGAHIGHSYSPPERDPPWMREHNGSSDEVKEQMEVLRSLTESDKLVQQLRAERRARKESRGRARRRRGESGWEEKQGRGQAQGGASRDVPLDPLPGASGRSDPLHWRDTGSVSELVTDDAFLQAIALEDSLLAEDAGAFPGSADLDYLNAFASEGDDCKGARQAGVQPAEGQLETEWQSLAALLERSLAGLGAGHGGDTPVAVGNWKQELAPRYKGTESSSRVEQSVQLVPLRQGQTIQQVDPPEKRPKERPQEEWGDGVAFAGPSGEVRAVSGVENDVEKNLKVSGAAFVGPASEWALGSEREETGGVEEKRVRSEQAGEASAGAKNGARNRESDVKAPMTPEERNSGGDTQQDLVSRLMQEVEEKTGEIQPLLTRVQVRRDTRAQPTCITGCRRSSACVPKWRGELA